MKSDVLHKKHDAKYNDRGQVQKICVKNYSRRKNDHNEGMEIFSDRCSSLAFLWWDFVQGIDGAYDPQVEV